MRLIFPPPFRGVLLLLAVILFVTGCVDQRTPKPLVGAGDPRAATIVSVSTVPLGAPISHVAEASVQPERPDSAATQAPSEGARKLKLFVGRAIDAAADMDNATLVGLLLLLAMLVFHVLENRSPFFILAFAITSGIGSAYGFLHWPWSFGVLAAIWGVAALRKWWREIKARNGRTGNAKKPLLVWPTRYAYSAAVVCGVILLIVDSPFSAHLRIPVGRAFVEAAPLLFVGVAFLAWLAIDRPSIVDLIKQAFIALAFILWGIDILLPAGRWATFIGAVVIAIYVFDLAWLMEGNLRKKFGVHRSTGGNVCNSDDCRSAGVCNCGGASDNSRNVEDGATLADVRGEVQPRGKFPLA